MATSKSNNKVYQIKIKLKGTKPPIWRRVQVLDNINLSDLHILIQTVMGWDNYHLHQFDIYGEYYSDPEMLDYDYVKNENKFKLSKFKFREKDKFIYEYDFGDFWEHEILIEKILPVDNNVKYPICIGGKLACPPEDCGGIWGYYELLNTISNPENEGYEDMIEWLGYDFDPVYFSIEETNIYLGL